MHIILDMKSSLAEGLTKGAITGYTWGLIGYTIEEKLDGHQYKLKICQKVGGSIGSYCDKIIVQFANRDYVRKEFVIKNVLVLDKLGEWE